MTEQSWANPLKFFQKNIQNCVQPLALLFPAALLLGALPVKALPSLINGSFEEPVVVSTDCGQPFTSLPCYALINENNVPGWDTTATDNLIEFWTNGLFGVNAYQGSQFAELNATQESTLFQDVSGIPAGSPVGYEFAHRGRNGIDTMRLTISDGSTVLFTSDFSTGNTGWAFYSNPNALIATGNTLTFAYGAVSTSTGNIKEGNLLDVVRFGVGVGTQSVPGPLPLLGVGSAFAFSRRLRRRIRGYRSPAA